MEISIPGTNLVITAQRFHCGRVQRYANLLGNADLARVVTISSTIRASKTERNM